MKSISIFLDIAKFAGFTVKKSRCQQNSSGVSHDSYRYGRCVADIREGGLFCPHQ